MRETKGLKDVRGQSGFPRNRTNRIYNERDRKRDRERERDSDRKEGAWVTW
jgi:hypothetical protein